MIILTLRTDKPEAEVGIYDVRTQTIYHVWEAHRQLAETLHTTIEQTLSDNDMKLENIEGIVIFKGPGSFTGLRIGLSVANSLAYSLAIPIIGSMDPSWIETGIEKLLAGDNDKVAVPEYGAPVHITLPKH